MRADRVEPTSQPPASSWHGVGLRRVPGCERCCGLVFAPSFGADNADELQIVKDIAAGEGRAEELDCHFSYGKQAFEHLRALAEKQVRAAAQLILEAKSDGGIDLGGGELAEVFGLEFMVPVLERFQGLKELVTPQLEEHVATNVCSSAYGMVPGKTLDVDRLARVLKERGVPSLASRIKEVCAAMARERAQ